MDCGAAERQTYGSCSERAMTCQLLPTCSPLFAPYELPLNASVLLSYSDARSDCSNISVYGLPPVVKDPADTKLVWTASVDILGFVVMQRECIEPAWKSVG